ncbi:MAG: putative colanic acid biosynthesis acetyltransferase [Bacteroidales bacterium]|nr:putative colanic acid biosynthesis acetyltransferase [Bacteroidales bacterium]
MIQPNQINLSQYKNQFSLTHQIKRWLWAVCWFILARPFPRSIGNKWRILLLKIFGAKIKWTCGIYSSTRIWAPWNLEMDDYSTLGPEVDCYNVNKVIIGKQVVISQKAYLCTASHNYKSKTFELISAPIIIKDQVWIGTAAFIHMGVVLNEGCIVAATSTVTKDVDPWTIVGGNPAKFIKKRDLYE